MRRNEVDVCAYEAKLRAEERNVDHDLACLAVDFLADVRQGTSHFGMHLDQKHCAVDGQTQRSENANRRKTIPTIDEVLRQIEDSRGNEAFENGESRSQGSQLLLLLDGLFLDDATPSLRRLVHQLSDYIRVVFFIFICTDTMRPLGCGKTCCGEDA